MTSTPPSPVHVVGAGLAGSECAWQLAERGVPVVLHEMRPGRETPAHSTGHFAELVCSNSFRSDDPLHAAGLLKREMESMGSLVIRSAREAAVPAGGALAMDRDDFALRVTRALKDHPRIEIREGEITEIPPPEDGDWVLATGPLTSPDLAAALQGLLGSEYLYFYDAIAPIVDRESLDASKLFWQSRYDKGDTADYLNAPMDEAEYEAFLAALLAAEVQPLHSFEKAMFFEGCLPVEEIARRGPETLLFGCMKSVGLRRPDGTQPHAVVQLRQENLTKSYMNMVGFQSRMKWGEQQRVFRMIPGFENAEFVRLGQIHRNTFINSPTHLDRFYRVKAAPHVRLAGQITGVEGYLESAATGLAIAVYLAAERAAAGNGASEVEPFPATTALGALARHLTESEAKHFQPANINYGLFEELGRKIKKRDRRAAYAHRAHAELAAWQERNGLPVVRIPDTQPEPYKKKYPKTSAPQPAPQPEAS